jgi:hypothetical protein
LIREAPDDDRTANALNELLNELNGRYSELTIFRALAMKFSRANAERQSARRERVETVSTRRNRKRQAQDRQAEVRERRTNDALEQHPDIPCAIVSAKVLEFGRARRTDDTALASVS